MKLYEYSGAIHFHSIYSFDGRVSVSDILNAANKNNLDFLGLTDHSILDAKGLEGWHGRTLLIVGQEISPRFNHYLAFGLDVPIPMDEHAEVPPQSYIDEVAAKGGFGFIAHPDHEGTEMFHVKHYPWIDWSVTGYTGMGIWDFMTDWQSRLGRFPKSLLCYLFPAYVLKGPRPVTLERWDSLCRNSKVVGIGELDNHDTLYRFAGGLKIGVFPFRKAFRFVRTHLLTESPLGGDKKEDIEKLLKAMRSGRAYFAMEYFKNAKGFSFSISGEGGEATMGDEFLLKKEAVLSVTIPGNGKIRIVKDGKLFKEVSGSTVEIVISEAGVYRVEGFLRKLGRYRPWIFSNPIYAI
jgi:hypothetical protein